MEKILYPPILISGNTINSIEIVKIPPYHCVRLRQNRIDFGRISGLGSKDVPVDVKPDIVSNKISVNELKLLLRRNGKVPIRMTTIHVIMIKTILSLLEVTWLFFFDKVYIKHTPTDKAIREGMTSGHNCSLLVRATRVQNNSNKPSRINKKDIIPFVFLNFI
jgi:hypothetical protein